MIFASTRLFRTPMIDSFVELVVDIHLRTGRMMISCQLCRLGSPESGRLIVAVAGMYAAKIVNHDVWSKGANDSDHVR